MNTKILADCQIFNSVPLNIKKKTHLKYRYFNCQLNENKEKGEAYKTKMQKMAEADLGMLQYPRWSSL